MAVIPATGNRVSRIVTQAAGLAVFVITSAILWLLAWPAKHWFAEKNYAAGAAWCIGLIVVSFAIAAAAGRRR